MSVNLTFKMLVEGVQQYMRRQKLCLISPGAQGLVALEKTADCREQRELGGRQSEVRMREVKLTISS